MATTTKQKAKSTAKQKVGELNAELIDVYAKLDARIRAAEERLKPHREKLAGMMAEISTYVDATTKPEDGTRLEGESYAIEFSAKGKATEILDVKAVFKALESISKGLALELAKVSITDLRKYLRPDELAGLVKEEYRNARRSKVKCL
jgi:hypothetical protein